MKRGPKPVARTIAPVLAGLVVLVLGLPLVLIPSISSPGPTAKVGGFDLGDGLADFPTAQSVSATPYWDDFNCPTPAYCNWDIGIAYVPSAGIAIVAEGHCTGLEGCNETNNQLVEFDPSESAYSIPLLLNCTPQNPFYPDEGTAVYVPCVSGATGLWTILELDYQSGRIVGNISDSIGSTAMAYDATNGLLYSGQGAFLQAINPQTSSVEWTVRIPNATFTANDSVIPGWFTLVYDPLTDQLIAPSTLNSLLAIDPTNGAVEAELPVPAPVLSLAIDPSTKQLFAATVDQSYRSVVTVFDALSYRSLATLAIPGCIDNVCAEPDDVNVMLIDPTHGDVYLVVTVGFITLNLSSLSFVGITEGYGDGDQGSAVYVPGLDQIIGTYPSLALPAPGFLVQLHHSTYLILAELLWQPPLAGVVTASQIAIGSMLFAVFRRRERLYRVQAGLPRRLFVRI